jgi:ABC-2 type transport system ATP-binding protein
MKQKLAIARALIHDPPILFLDEPTANLDPEASKTVRDFILELKRENRTIFLNTHLLSEAEKLCDRVGIIKTKLLAVDTPENLIQSLSGTKTVIQLEIVNDKIIMAVEKLKSGEVEVIDNKLVINVIDPELENPDILKAIQSAGSRIQLVNEVKSTLEEVYLKYVRRE